MKFIVPSTMAIAASLALATILGPSVTFADYLINTLSDTSGNTGWGTSATPRIAQSFTTVAAGSVNAIDTYQLINGGTGNDYFITIESDAGGTPDGVALDTSNTVSNLNSCSSAQQVSFSGAAPLAASTKYWAVFHMIGVPDDTNNNEGCGAIDSYAGGTQLRDNGGWTDQGIDEKMIIYLTTGGSGGGGGLGGATSTVDQAETNLAYATWIFLSSMVIMIWIMRKK